MVVEQKPYQWLAWLATATLVIAASLASFIPEIWQGHKNDGEGFWIALTRLENIL